MVKINPLKTACFTGPRPHKMGGWDETTPLWRQVRQDLRDAVLDLMTGGYDTFISGMALGVDMVAAEVVLQIKQDMPEMGIRLIAALPYSGQALKWQLESRMRYVGIVNQADHVEIVCGGNYTAYKFSARNHWMVDYSSYVIAVDDGVPKEHSGTSECVQFAQRMGRSIYFVSPTLMVTT